MNEFKLFFKRLFRFSDPPLSPDNGGRSILPSILEIGDIVVSSSNTLQSRIIQNQLDYPISHARILFDKTDPNNPRFIEAVASGVQFKMFNEMMDEEFVIVAFRKTSLDNRLKNILTDWLIGKLGADYDFGAVFRDWLLLKFRYSGNEFSIDIGNTNKFYCSELIFEGYNQIGIPLIDFNSWSRLPTRFIEMSYFDNLNYIGHLKY